MPDVERTHAEAVSRATAALRAIRDALARDGLDPAAVEAEAEVLEGVAARLGAAPLPTTIEWGAPGTHYLRSPVSGAGNVVAPPLVYDTTTPRDRSLASVTFSRAFEGPPGNVHGGWVAAAFDDILGRVQSTAGHSGRTGTISVRLIAPTPIERPLTMTAAMVSVDGRKGIARGELLDGDRVCATGEAIFIRPANEPPPESR